MDIFEIINKNRLTFNYPSKEYKALMLKNKNELIYKLELCTCKYYLLRSKKYLKKNLKLSPSTLYTDYISCLLTNEIEKILSLRSKLEVYDSFVTELDTLLSNLNFNINNIKSKYYWNDIEITFNTEKKMNDYINNKYKIEDKKYNNQLIMFINKVNNKIQAVKSLLKKDKTRVDCIKKKFQVLSKVTVTFLNFLSDNYVESEYLTSLKNEVDNILAFYKDGDKLKLNIFSDVETEIVSSKNVKTKKEVREELINYLCRIFTPPKDQVENIPFLPDFYDIAYDYIKYPSIDQNLNDLIMNIDINK